jgi:hypothetical protein
MKNKKKKYMDYNTLQQVMENEQIYSKASYIRWYNLFLPTEIAPKHPDFYFRRRGEWQGGWPAFLKNNNTFGTYYKNRTFWTFEQGLLWARGSGIKNSTEWCDVSTTLPKYLMRRPDLYWIKENHWIKEGYTETPWRGWRFWLGSGLPTVSYFVENEQLKAKIKEK